MDERRIEGRGPAGPVPGRLYVPDGGVPGLVLIGHGGNGGKDLPRFVELSRRFAEGTGLAALCIDGPVHGERAPNTGDAAEDFAVARRTIAAAGTSEQMVADWQAAVAAAEAGPALAYAGFSMGFAFGVPTVAAIRTIRAAVLALGGFAKPGALARFVRSVAGDRGGDVAQDVHAQDARITVIRDSVGHLDHCETLMLNMRDDEIFDIEGALEFFDAVPGPKRMAVFPGGHVQLPAEAIDLAVAFISRVLLAREPATPAQAF